MKFKESHLFKNLVLFIGYILMTKFLLNKIVL